MRKLGAKTAEPPPYAELAASHSQLRSRGFEHKERAPQQSPPAGRPWMRVGDRDEHDQPSFSSSSSSSQFIIIIDDERRRTNNNNNNDR